MAGYQTVPWQLLKDSCSSEPIYSAQYAVKAAQSAANEA